MSENKKFRVSRLEEHRTATDQKKEYCSCRCHRKSILDFHVLSDEKILAMAEIVERLAPNYFEDLQERIKNRPKCTCSCSH